MSVKSFEKQTVRAENKPNQPEGTVTLRQLAFDLGKSYRIVSAVAKKFGYTSRGNNNFKEGLQPIFLTPEEVATITADFDRPKRHPGNAAALERYREKKKHGATVADLNAAEARSLVREAEDITKPIDTGDLLEGAKRSLEEGLTPVNPTVTPQSPVSSVQPAETASPSAIDSLSLEEVI